MGGVYAGAHGAGKNPNSRSPFFEVFFFGASLRFFFLLFFLGFWVVLVRFAVCQELLMSF